MKRFRKGLWVGACVAIFLIAGFGASAQTDPPKFFAPVLMVPIPGLDFFKHPIIKRDNIVEIPFFAAYVSAVYTYLTGIAVVAAAVMIVYAGFHYIIGSSTGKIGRAKEIIVDAIIGLLLILGSYVILYTVNPSTITGLKSLAVPYVKPTPILVSEKYSEGVPMEQWDAWSAGPGRTVPVPPAAPGQPPTGFEKGCGANSPHKPPPNLCITREACLTRFCEQKDYTPPDGLPALTDLVGFTEIFPPTQREQILEKGIGFFPIRELCTGKNGCPTTKLFSVTTHGPAAKPTNVYRMKGGMIFRQEARDALIKAGEEAKKRGYFLIVGDGTRTMSAVAQAWCGRIKSTGGTQGLATPGKSPHMLGVAVDVALYQMVGSDRYRQLTAVGVCGQTAGQNLLGIEHMRTLEDIMSAAGFKHLCSEVHHFNYLGVYGSDCTTCEWPGDFLKREGQEKC